MCIRDSLSVAEEAIESGLYETLQFPFSYLASDEEIALAEKCRKADMGFIAMKGMSGGLIKRADAAYAFMSRFENVLPIWGVQKMEELKQFQMCIRDRKTAPDFGLQNFCCKVPYTLRRFFLYPDTAASYHSPETL